MDWSLRACARNGHVTYRPTEVALIEGLHTQTPVGEAWKCLRCGAFIPGAPFEHGPAELAPEVLHDRQIRDRLIIRFLAVERGLRGLLVWFVAWIVWQLRSSMDSLENLFARTLSAIKPIADQLDWNIKDSHLIHLLNDAVMSSQHTLTVVFIALAAYGVLQCVEAGGLWFMKRWAEYLTVVATSLFIPLEVYELASKVTALRLGAFLLNVGAVIWLVWTKHLFGLNGGAAAAHEDVPSGRNAIEYALAMHTTVPSP